MKSILKTMPAELDMNYGDTFFSQTNVEIRRKLVPELMKAMIPNYQVSYNQLVQWLKSLHKSRRSQRIYLNKGTLDTDNRRIHANSRLNEV